MYLLSADVLLMAYMVCDFIHSFHYSFFYSVSAPRKSVCFTDGIRCIFLINLND